MRKPKITAACALLALTMCVAFSVFSCDVGMGQAVDLEAPVLTIDSHENLDYVGATINLSGSCTDNVGVSRIEVVNVSTVGPDAGAVYGGVSISGTEWSVTLLNLSEGEQNLRITAYDKGGNSSVDSMKQITLLVDNDGPSVDSLMIDRFGGFYVASKARDYLESLDASRAVYMDLFQNGSFGIDAEVVENFAVSAATLRLYNETGTLVLSKVLDPAENLMSPSFPITHAELVAANPAYATGRHYLRITIECVDIGGNTNADECGWLCWYPEADLPHIIQSMAVDNLLTIPKDSMIPVEYFDDDGLDAVYVAIVPTASWAAVAGATDDAKLQTLISNSAARSALLGASIAPGTKPRSFSKNLLAGSASGEYRIVSLARDWKSNGDESVWSGSAIRLLVTDQDSPLVVVQSPSENSFPALSGGTSFNFAGYCLDNSSIGSFRVAWIPAGIAGGADASVDEAIDAMRSVAVASGSSVTTGDGIKIWAPTLGAPTNEVVNGRTYRRYAYSQSMNVLTDFFFGGSLENATKLFVLYARDADNNEITQTFRLLGDSTGPTLSAVVPGDLDVKALNVPLTVSFTASKASGLGITSWSIQDTTAGSPGTELSLVAAGNTRSHTFDAATVTAWGEGRRTYLFSAVDALGNESTAQRTVILSDLPVMTRVTSGEIDGAYPQGREIIIQAAFTKPVRVTGSPRLDLRYSAADSTPKYATFVTESNGSDTLRFRYVVPAGASSADLRSAYAPIDLNGATIESTEGTGGTAFIPGIDGYPVLDDAHSLHGAKDISLDGTVPTISSITVAAIAGTAPYMSGESFAVTVTLSEPVLVSGSPVLRLPNDSGGYVSVAFQSASGTQLVFSHTVVSGDNATARAFAAATCLSAADAALIADAAGNPLALTGSATSAAVTVDTMVPGAPAFTGIAAGNYNSVQQFTLTGVAGTTLYYSTNGGLSWIAYPGSAVTLGAGTWAVTARQIDAAGNVSPSVSPTMNISIDTGFPAITSISCEQPNGYYREGATLTFKLSFAEPVRTVGAGAYLTLVADGTSVDLAHATVTEAGALEGTTTLTFTYTVAAGDTIDYVDVLGATLTNVQDPFGNTPAANPVLPAFDRPNLVVDGTVPTIVTSVPTNGDVMADGVTTVTLNFSEPVYADTGLITVQRRGDWSIPLVLSEDEFRSVYFTSTLTEANRDALMQGTNGSPTLETNTGHAVGPYQPTTHGLKLSGTSTYVPDTATKYVLRFEYGCAELGGAANTAHDAVVANIRTALEAANYHTQTVDVTSGYVNVSGSTVTISFPTALVAGREWDLLVPAGAFRDAAGNVNAAIEEDDYRFWSSGVAIPVVRVDRQSYGVINNNTVPAFTAMVAPTGTTQVRIDCETPGARISSAVRNHASYTPTADTTGLSTNADVPSATLDALSLVADGAYDSAIAPFNVGDGSFKSAEKIYIRAIAERPGHTTSGSGREGAFKTLVAYWNPTRNTNNHVIQGTDVRGGVPIVASFPLKDADPDWRYSRYYYQITEDGHYNCYWISWEIVNTWYNMGKYNFPGGNYQQGYNECRYGQATYKPNQAYW